MFGIFTQSAVLPALMQKIALLQFSNVYTGHNFIVLIEFLAYAYAAFLAGSLFLNFGKVNGLSRGRWIAYSVMIGYAFFGFLGLLLSVFGLFNSTLLRIVFAGVFVFSWRSIRDDLRRIIEILRTIPLQIKSLFHEYAFLKIVIALWLAINFVIVFVPLTGHDTLDYHLPIILNLIEKGGFDFGSIPSNTTILTSSIPIYFLPILGEIMYAVPITIFNNFQDPFIFQLIQYSFLILFIVLLYEFLKIRSGNKFLNLSSIILLLGIMDFQREIMHGGYIDVFVFLYGIASMLILIENCCNADFKPKELALSALMLGVALGVKYLALVFAVINSVFLLIMFLQLRKTLFDSMKWVLRYGFIAFAVSGFWYIKNTLLFGSPIYPMFSSQSFTSQVNMFLLERTPIHFLQFPFYRYGQWFVQEVETSSRLLVLGYFIAAYFLIAGALFLRRRLRVDEVLLFLGIQIYLFFLFFMSHQYRFLLPANILLVPLLIILGDRLLNFWKKQFSEKAHRVFMRVFQWSFSLCAVFLLLANIHYFHVKFLYATGIYNQEEYISEIGGF